MTLHQTTEFFHKFLKSFIILAGTIIVLVLLFNIFRIMFKILNPPPPDYPDVLFGKLPSVVFPKSTVNENFTYSLNTLSGTLPVLSDRAKVYKTEISPVTLLNVQNAREKVSKIGFIDEKDKQFREFVLTDTRYQWQVVTNGLLRTIVMNTDTYDFKLTSTYRTYPPILNQSRIGDEISAKEVIDKFFTSMNLSREDIDMEDAKIRSLMLETGVLIPADSVSSTHIYRVDLFQKKLDEKPIYYPTHPFSSMYFLMMARSHDTEDILEANFNHQIIASESASYPIKTAEEAYSELKEGKGYIANYFGTSSSIPITDVTLGYYLGEERTGYIFPVILFQSKEEFFAFVPAIKETCLTSNNASIEECQGKAGSSK